MENLAYKIGGLFYIPAMNKTAADKIVNKQFEGLTACCFCLEDSICDDALTEAENMVMNNLKKISTMQPKDRPLIFIRIRTSEHLDMMHEKLRPYHDVYTGYVLPKFDLSNSSAYVQKINLINHTENKTFYFMPILESRMIADASTRIKTLKTLKHTIDTVKEFVPNIRVGGNDFCNLFGLRRNLHQTIWDIGIIRDILIDIANIFSMDYVVSGPVWEYFGTDNTEEWADGLRTEMELGKLNGFTGKTAIHPSQLPIINEMLQVTQTDYEEACSILEWKPDGFAVKKSKSSRMNEIKCHTRWARKVKTMGDIYGIRE